ncbi:MAG: poly-gamma-glutamate system protein [Planctomycetota bacterium]
MKRLYYQPNHVSAAALTRLAIFAMVVVAVLRWAPSRLPFIESSLRSRLPVDDLYDRMMEASYRTALSFDAIHCHRVKQGHPLLDQHDPANTGMIGPSMSMVTTLPGHLEAKQTSVNPNFAAVAMRLMVDAGVRPGDRIAIGCTGSFPALNIAVIAAAEALEIDPVIISSAASSQYGANSPDLMWPDIEKLLFDEELIQSRSQRISRGGFKDRAAGMTDQTRVMLEDAIDRSGVPLMDSRDDEDAIERRMLLYAAIAEDERYQAYINVGGGDASVGGTKGNQALGAGLIQPTGMLARRMHDWLSNVQDENATQNKTEDCVARRFLASGVPVLNMIRTVDLAKAYGLPIASPHRIEVGQGAVFALHDMRRYLAVIGIVLITVMTGWVMRPPAIWVRYRQQNRGTKSDYQSQPQWMV